MNGTHSIDRMDWRIETRVIFNFEIQALHLKKNLHQIIEKEG